MDNRAIQDVIHASWFVKLTMTQHGKQIMEEDDTTMKDNKDFDGKTVTNDNGSHTVFSKLCKGCGICKEICPVGAISWDDDRTGVYNGPTIKVDMNKCTLCGLCGMRCPDSAIKVERKDKK